MNLQMWMLFVWALSLTDSSETVLAEDSATVADNQDMPSRQNDKFANLDYPYTRGNGEFLDERIPENSLRCSERLEVALEQIRKRQLNKQRVLNLNGYTLHQPMRTVPYDMYVTDMRVRVPSTQTWVRVDNCRFNPRNASLDTQLLFNDLTISGRVNLFNEAELQREPLEPNPESSCPMILRLRRAGIGFHTEPIRLERGQFNVRTDSHFLEPGFISVYAYGCEPRGREYRRDILDLEDDDISREMEDIFLKGIRSLLTSYMQKELQPAIKETLMKNLGYTISYG